MPSLGRAGLRASRSPSTPNSSRTQHTCIRCVARKVKCDRQEPCGACVKHKVDCSFPEAGRSAKRQRISQGHSQAAVAEVIQTDRSEASPSAQDVSRRSDAATASYESEDVRAAIPSRARPHWHTWQHEDGSKIAENALYDRVAEELSDSHDLHSDEDPVGVDTPNTHFVFGGPSTTKGKSCHPSARQIRELWTAYSENVDPLTKVVHVPTVTMAIERFVAEPASVPKGLEALMFAMYSAAISSWSGQECQQYLGLSWDDALARYSAYTRKVLSAVNFMSTTSLVVLQALVIHIISLRNTESSSTIWSLNGVAIRIAQNMGLARDGESQGLSFYETEIRRRIWWFLKVHDMQTAELCGLAKLRVLDTGSYSPKWPSDIDDHAFGPGMGEVTVSEGTITDCIFIAVKGELAKFTAMAISRMRPQEDDASEWTLANAKLMINNLDEEAKSLEERFETKYIRYCDPSQPLQLMAMLTARTSITYIKFMTMYQKRGWPGGAPTKEETVLAWQTALKSLEQHHMVYSNPSLKRFSWHAAYYTPWHALIYILDCLHVDPMVNGQQKAWKLINDMYLDSLHTMLKVSERLPVAIALLYQKTWMATINHERKEGRRIENSASYNIVLQQFERLKDKRSKRRSNESARRKAPSPPTVPGDALGDNNVVSDTVQSAIIPLDDANRLAHIDKVGPAPQHRDNFWITSGFAEIRYDGDWTDDLPFGGLDGLDDTSYALSYQHDLEALLSEL